MGPIEAGCEAVLRPVAGAGRMGSRVRRWSDYSTDATADVEWSLASTPPSSQGGGQGLSARDGGRVEGVWQSGDGGQPLPVALEREGRLPGEVVIAVGLAVHIPGDEVEPLVAGVGAQARHLPVLVGGLGEVGQLPVAVQRDAPHVLSTSLTERAKYSTALAGGATGGVVPSALTSPFAPASQDAQGAGQKRLRARTGIRLRPGLCDIPAVFPQGVDSCEIVLDGDAPKHGVR